MKNKFIVGAVFVAALLALVGCPSTSPDKPVRGSHLIVGMELSYPPFEMLDENGKPTGISVDLAEALGQWMDKPVKIENINFDGLIPALKVGKIHVILSSMTATEERADSIDFTRPYLKTGLCLLVGTNSTVQSVQDLNAPGRKVAVKRGTTGQIYAQNHLQQATVITLDKEAEAVMEVVQGKVDAFIYDQISTFRHWQQHPERTRAILEPFTEEFWAMGVRKGDTNLQEMINQFLHDFQSEGGFEHLGDRYLKTEKEEFQKRGIPFYF